MGSSAANLAAELRIRGVFYCDTRLDSTAALRIPPMPGSMMFHVVLDGTCVIDVEGRREVLSPGDIALCPHGTGHLVGDGAQIHELEDTTRPLLGGNVEQLVLGSDRECTRVLCGALTVQHPAAPALPNVLADVHVVSAQDSGSSSIRALSELIDSEVSAVAPGWTDVVTRLVDSLAIVAVRAVLAGQARDSGWWHVFGDEHIAAAMDAVVAEPGRAWTLPTLASRAGMSRSSFAHRFAECTGNSPMAWVAQHRMRIARGMLEDGRSVAATARAVGYGSEVSFRRAFSSITGLPPGAVRRSAKSQETARIGSPTS